MKKKEEAYQDGDETNCSAKITHQGCPRRSHERRAQASSPLIKGTQAAPLIQRPRVVTSAAPNSTRFSRTKPNREEGSTGWTRKPCSSLYRLQSGTKCPNPAVKHSATPPTVKAQPKLQHPSKPRPTTPA
ncbi:hypothetical protein PIB30_091622, partial [Stylosanthes scabra]|nr:hypothetical protein [Stylosanthes scabra]